VELVSTVDSFSAAGSVLFVDWVCVQPASNALISIAALSVVAFAFIPILIRSPISVDWTASALPFEGPKEQSIELGRLPHKK
jgi:hypothetical protein